MSIVLIYTLCWFGLMIMAILNGMLRVFIYGTFMPEIRAHQLSTFSGIFLIGFAVWIIHTFFPIKSKNEAFLIGIIWFVITILFEFIFGHFVMKHTWKKLLHDYRIDKGRIWSFFLVWIFIVPYFIYKYF